MDDANVKRSPRVVQPGEVALMLPDEYERRLAALERSSAQAGAQQQPGAETTHSAAERGAADFSRG